MTWSVIRFEHLTLRYLMKELLDHPLMQGEAQRALVKEALASSLEHVLCVGVCPDTGGWEQVGEVPNCVDPCTYQSK